MLFGVAVWAWLWMWDSNGQLDDDLDGTVYGGDECKKTMTGTGEKRFRKGK